VAFTTVTVTGNYDLADGTDPTGTVTFTPTSPMVNGPTVVAAPVVGKLDVDGVLTIDLAANNDPATLPTGVSYLVKESVNGAVRSYYVVVPYDAGSPVDLSSLAAAGTAPTISFPAQPVLLAQTNYQTGSYTVASTDLNHVIEMDSASTTQVAVPASITVPIGGRVDVARLGTGAVLIQSENPNNLVTNPSIETGTTGYTTRGTSTTLSQVVNTNMPAAYGTKALRVTCGASVNFGFFYTVGTLSALGLQAGDVISARMDMAPVNSGTIQLQLRCQTTAGVSLLDSNGNQLSSAGTSKVENVTIPAGTQTIVAMAQTVSSGTATQYYECDGLMVVKAVRAPTAYADPSTSANYTWAGTAHASQSVGSPVVAGSLASVPRYGTVHLRRRSSTQWLIESQPQDEVILNSSTLYVDRDNGQAGMYAAAPVATLTAAALTSGQLYLARVAPSRVLVVTTVAFRVSTASGTNDPVDVGVFSSAGTLLTSSGSRSSLLNSTGTKTAPISVTLLPGSVYYAYLVATSTATLQHVTHPGDLFGTAMPQVEFLTKASVTPGSVPTSLTGTAAADAAPLLVLR